MGDNLRFDDTNPIKEDVEYVDSIMEDVKWLGLIGKTGFFMLLIISNNSMNSLYPNQERKSYVCDMTQRRSVKRGVLPPVPGKKVHIVVV